jgi:hypothetical protein
VTPPDGATLEELWSRWLAGQGLDATDRGALITGVEHNEVFRRRVIQDWQMHNALWAAAPDDNRDAVVARVTSAVRRTREPLPLPRGLLRWNAGRAAAVLGALAVAAAIAIGLGLSRPPAPAATGAVIAKLSGHVTVHTPTEAVMARPELILHPGDIISTVGASARVTLAFGEVPRLDLGPDSSLVVRPGRAGELGGLLLQGHATLASPLLRLETPHATVLGKGRLVADVSPRQTFVEVQQGRARILTTGNREETTLLTGQTTTVQPAVNANLSGSPTAILLVAFRAGQSETLGALQESDRLFKNRLEAIGFAVNVMAVDAASVEELRRANVVVLSFTVDAGALPDSFIDLPVPIVAVESSAFTQLRFTGPRWGRDVGNGPRLSDVLIANPDHPLAAGLEGSVRVFNHPMRVRWAAPPETATAVASYPGAPDENTLVFGYERGDFTADGRAAARRVGLFLGNDEIVRSLNEQGWRLFEAAVSWCASAHP